MVAVATNKDDEDAHEDEGEGGSADPAEVKVPGVGKRAADFPERHATRHVQQRQGVTSQPKRARSRNPTLLDRAGELSVRRYC